jgi:hypothetical protein
LKTLFSVTPFKKGASQQELKKGILVSGVEPLDNGTDAGMHNLCPNIVRKFFFSVFKSNQSSDTACFGRSLATLR